MGPRRGSLGYLSNWRNRSSIHFGTIQRPFLPFLSSIPRGCHDQDATSSTPSTSKLLRSSSLSLVSSAQDPTSELSSSLSLSPSTFNCPLVPKRCTRSRLSSYSRDYPSYLTGISAIGSTIVWRWKKIPGPTSLETVFPKLNDKLLTSIPSSGKTRARTPCISVMLGFYPGSHLVPSAAYASLHQCRHFFPHYFFTASFLQRATMFVAPISMSLHS